MSISSNQKANNIKVIFNGKPVGYVLVEYQKFIPDRDSSRRRIKTYNDWKRTIVLLDSNYIIKEIRKEDDMSNALEFEITKNGVERFLSYEVRDKLGLFKKEMIPLHYVINIKIGRSDDHMLQHEGMYNIPNENLSNDEIEKSE